MTETTIVGKVYATYFQVLVEGQDGWLPDYTQLGDWIGNLVQVIPGFVNILVQSDFRFVGLTVEEHSDQETPGDPREGCEADVEFDLDLDEFPARIVSLDDVSARPENSRIGGELRGYRIPPGRYRLRVQGYGLRAAAEERYRGEIANPETQPDDPAQLTEQLVIHIWPRIADRPSIVHRSRVPF